MLVESLVSYGLIGTQILGWIVFSYIFVSFFEWQIHRYLMHKKRLPKWVYRMSPYILETFEAHAIRHHGIYYKEFDYEPNPEGREYNLDIKVGETVTMLAAVSPFLIAMLWFWPLGGGILIGVTLLHNRAWNVLHRQMHLPQESWLKNSRVFHFLARHHFLHHEHPNSNYNVVFPLFDYLLGTNSRPTMHDLREMLRLGYLQPRHEGTQAILEQRRREVEARRAADEAPSVAAAV